MSHSFSFQDPPPSPVKAALLSAVCPGLGHFYAGQGGVAFSYLTVLSVVGFGTYDVYSRWTGNHGRSSEFQAYTILGVIVFAGLWLIQILDAGLRARRHRPLPEPDPSPRTLAAILSLIIPGMGHLYSRRFLPGIFNGPLVLMLILVGWQLYTDRYDPDFPVHGANHPMRTVWGSRILMIAAVVWLANVWDAWRFFGNDDVFPRAWTKYVTLPRMNSAWTDFTLAAGFFYIELEQLDGYWPDADRLVRYLGFWWVYEFFSFVARLGLLSHTGKLQGRRGGTLVINGIVIGGCLLAWGMASAGIPGGWLALAGGMILASHTLPWIFEPPRTDDYASAAGAAFLSFVIAGGLALLSLPFWAAVNPHFYRHLQDTFTTYEFGMFYFFLQGLFALRRHRAPVEAIA